MNNLSHIKITLRDAQVLKLLVQGCSNKEIADQLKISPRTENSICARCFYGPASGMAASA